MNVTLSNLWKFLSSVKFALFNLFTLAIVSIAGTIFEQKESAQYYVDVWGEATARLISMLGLDDMFNTDWYIFLLGMFSVNLLLCTIDRLPNVLRIMRQDPSQKSVENIEKRIVIAELDFEESQQKVSEKVAQYLGKYKWSNIKTQHHGDRAIFVSAQKGAWTRLAVYVVHTGVLIVLAGAIIGNVYGFKTAVLIPEGPLVEHQLFNAPVPITFEMRCDWFSIDFYDTGAPKQYRSEIALVKNGEQVHAETLSVNNPIIYDGITLYQETYEPIKNNYSLQLTNLATNEKKVFQIQPHMQNNWQEEKLVFGIVTTSAGDSVDEDHDHGPSEIRYQLAFSKEEANPQVLWVEENTPTQVEMPGGRYGIIIKQRYRTGLQVVKDPGVWIVYGGFTFMMLGLCVVFFLYHRQIWVSIIPMEKGCRILFRGSANKNRQTYTKQLKKMAENFR